MGCVQPSMMPNVNSARRACSTPPASRRLSQTSRLLRAIRLHLSDHDGALAHMRRNIDAWWPLVSTGAVEARHERIGCGVTVKEYGHSLARDPHYAAKATRIADLTRDVSELLPDIVGAIKTKLAAGGRKPRLAFHPPCTLQHGQRLRDGVEAGLAALGFEVGVAMNEAHLCCGSAGTYSVLQPELATALRDRKLVNLKELAPEAIVSANIGCIQHLQSGTTTPVRHWVEVLDDALAR